MARGMGSLLAEMELAHASHVLRAFHSRQENNADKKALML